MSYVLEIRLLGSFLLQWEGEQGKGTFSPRARILLAYLLINRHANMSRRQIAFHLWPDSSEEQAFANFRTLLTQLRKALPGADRYLTIDRHTVQWNMASHYRLDVEEFEKSLSSGDVERAVNLYTGDLLPDCYDDWIHPERERLREEYCQAMVRLLQDREDARDYAAAVRYAQAYLQQDPLKESTYRRLMRLHALVGDRTEAMRVFQQCALTLQSELGVEPETETRQAYEKILQLFGRPEPVCGSKNDLPLVGRSCHWQRLLERWRAAESGSPGMLLLVGEAGIGKTRLLEEFREWAYRQGITTAFARCYSAQGRLAYAPPAGWLRCPPIRENLAGLEAVWLTEIARLLPEISVEFPGLPEPGPIKEGWQQMRLFEALARGIFSAPQPLLLVLDDLQWADRETLSWLSYLVRFNPQAELLILGSLRPEEPGTGENLDPLRLDLQREGLLVEFELRPFDLKDSLELVDSISSGACTPEEGQRIYKETEGNPLFIVEMVRSLSGEEMGENLAGSTGLFNLNYKLPGKMEAVISSRLSQLGGQAQSLAALAAASGRQFNFKVLSIAWKSREDELVAGLDELRRRRIVRELDEEAYDFAHDKIREAVYQRLSLAHRSLLHRSLAQALEYIHPREIDAVSGEIAAHYLKAGYGMQALPYLLKAAHHAVRLYANLEAIQHLRLGVGIITTSPPEYYPDDNETETIFSMLALLGDVLEKIGEHQEARDTYDLVFLHCPRLDGVREAQTHRKIGQTWLAQQNFDSMIKAYNAAEAALGSPTPGQTQDQYQLNWHQERLNVFLKRMWLHYWLNEPEKIQELAEKSLPILDTYGSPHQRADYYSCLAGMVMRREKYARNSEAVQHMRRALEAARQAGDEGLLGFTSFGMGYGLHCAEELAEAEEHMLNSIAISERIGDEQTLVLTLTYLGFIYRKLGRLDDARLIINRGHDLSTRGGRPMYIGIAKSHQAWLAWRDGEYAEARIKGDEALEILSKVPINFPFKWSARWPIIGAALEEGDLFTAIEHARRLFSPEQQAQPEIITEVLKNSIECWESERLQDVRFYLNEAVRLAGEMGYL